jgi:hypothetical protein
MSALKLYFLVFDLGLSFFLYVDAQDKNSGFFKLNTLQHIQIIEVKQKILYKSLNRT